MTSTDTVGSSAPQRPIAVKRLSAAKFNGGEPHLQECNAEPTSSLVLRLVSLAGQLEVIVEARHLEDLSALRLQADHGRMRLLIGDESQLEYFDLTECYANLLQADLDLRLGCVHCSTSVVGLPPLFIVEAARGAALAAPLRPDRAHALGLGRLDLEAAADVLRWGHPIDNRTLACGLRLAPPGSRVTLSAAGVHIERLPSADWDLTSTNADPAEIVEQQMAVFARAAGRMDARAAFMSLSGGLDSRAVAAATLCAGRVVPCVTLALERRSLDAQLAAAFCKVYGLEHRIILTGDAFCRGLAERVVRSAHMTLGVSALSQSIDLYLYEQMGSNIPNRISGNLGNQVGRGGVESVTASVHPGEGFSPELRRALDARPVEPWYVTRMRTQGFSRTLFTEEVNYWSIPNYVLGSAYAVQLTPYADRRLIRLSAQLFAGLDELRAPTARSIRQRDLRHRLAGPPIKQSFQRSFLRDFDARGKRVAINWGWLARGGWSPRWLLAALPTVASAGLSKFAPAMHGIRRALPPFGLADWPALLREDLRELTNDCFASEAVRNSGLFDPEKMARLLDRHFRGIEAHHETVARVLEIGLACLVVAEDNEACRPTCQ